MFSLLDDTTKIYILCGYTDFRKGMDSLTQIAVEHGVEIQKNCLVLFMSKRKDRIKMLRWVKTGMILLTYCLEKEKFVWLKGNEVKSITRKQLEWMAFFQRRLGRQEQRELPGLRIVVFPSLSSMSHPTILSI